RTANSTLSLHDALPIYIKGTVTLRALMGPPKTINVSVTSLSQPVTFSVPPGTMWQATIDVAGWWANPVAVTVQETDVDVRVPLLDRKSTRLNSSHVSIS